MSLALTLLTNARTQKSITDLQENRTRTFGLKELVDSDTENLINAAEIAEDRTLDSRTVQIPVINRLDRSTSFTDSRACSPTVEDSTSTLQSITWHTATFYTTMVEIEHQDNEISAQRKFTHQLESGIRSVCEDIEATIYSVLNTNKTQVLTNPVDAIIEFDTTFDVLQVPQAQKATMWNYIKYIMRENAFMPKFNVAASWGLHPEIDYYINQGAGNSANTAFQFGDYKFYGSTGITNTSGHQGTFFVMPMGSIGIVYWVSKQARKGGMAAGSNGLMEWGTANVPLVGNMATKSWKTCVDISATYAGMTDAIAEKTEFSIDYAVVPLYNSDLSTLANAIVKGVLLETGGSS